MKTIATPQANTGATTKKRFTWTPAAIAQLCQLYPMQPCTPIAHALGASEKAVYYKAHALGLKKDPAYYQTETAGRIQRGRNDPRMLASQFKPGFVPWNAGRKGWQAGGRSVATQFTKGMVPRNTQPVGSLRIITSNDGVQQLERKIGTTPGPGNKRWRAVHRLVWEAAHGPVPAGHIVVFKPGQKTLIEAEITLDKVECITRAENAKRNHPRNKSPELAKLYQLKGAITRQINRITRESTQRP